MKYVVLVLVAVVLFLLVTRYREGRLARGGLSSGARIRVEGLLAQGREADAVAVYRAHRPCPLGPRGRPRSRPPAAAPSAGRSRPDG